MENIETVPVAPPVPVESFWEKAVRKTKNEPLVPVGAIVTTFFLLRGLSAFHQGDKKRAQMLMRGRVAAQAFTVLAMGVGAFYGFKPHNRPTNMEEKMEQKAKEN